MDDRIVCLRLFYRLRKPAAALYQNDGKSLYIHLAPGSLVQLASLTDEQEHLIEVLYEGRRLVMRAEDVQRGDLLEGEAPEPSDGDLWPGTVQ
jgi:hypothetical protein